MPTLIDRLFKRTEKRDSIGQQLQDIMQRAISSAGIPVTPYNIWQLSTSMACMRLLGEIISGFPLNVYEVMDDGSKRLAKEHPLYVLLQNAPNPNMTINTLIYNVFLQELGYGNGYINVEWGKDGYPKYLWPMQSASTALYLAPGQTVSSYDPQGYYYSTLMQKNPLFPLAYRLLPQEVIHVPFIPINHAYIGWSQSVISLSSQTLSLAMAMDAFSSSFYRNGMTMGGIFETEKALDPDLKKRIQLWFDKNKVGPMNAWEPFFAPPGFKYTKTSSNLAESQNIEQRQFAVEDTCRIYRVPPHMIGDTKGAKMSNVEQQSLEFVEYVVRPECIKWEKAIENTCIIGDEKGRFIVEFDFSSLLRADYTARQRGLAVQRQNGIINANEWRKVEGLNPLDPKVVPGAEEYIILSNMAGLGTQLPTSKVVNQNVDQTEENTEEEDVSGSRGLMMIRNLSAKQPKIDNIEVFKSLHPVFTDAALSLAKYEEKYLLDMSNKPANSDKKEFIKALEVPDFNRKFMSAIMSYCNLIGKNGHSSGTNQVYEKYLESVPYEHGFLARAQHFIMTGEYDMPKAVTEIIEIVKASL